MTDAVSLSLGLVAYLALFAAVGIVFLLTNLLVGRLLRPANPYPEKLEIYECGEPAVGTGFVQFDLRFYVVALLFIIFDVEVAFFFPWATVFGKATHLASPTMAQLAVVDADGTVSLTPEAHGLYQELGVRRPTVPAVVPASLTRAIGSDLPGEQQAAEIIRHGARQLAIVALGDMLIFFAVLMVGFAYVWVRGDLDWVRAYGRERAVDPGALGGRREPSDLEPARTA